MILGPDSLPDRSNPHSFTAADAFHFRFDDFNAANAVVGRHDRGLLPLLHAVEEVAQFRDVSKPRPAIDRLVFTALADFERLLARQIKEMMET